MTPLMTAKDVAKTLNISVRTVWRLKRSGGLPVAIRVGRGVRWNFQTIQEWMSEQKGPMSQEVIS